MSMCGTPPMKVLKEAGSDPTALDLSPVVCAGVLLKGTHILASTSTKVI